MYPSGQKLHVYSAVKASVRYPAYILECVGCGGLRKTPCRLFDMVLVVLLEGLNPLEYTGSGLVGLYLGKWSGGWCQWDAHQ